MAAEEPAEVKEEAVVGVVAVDLHAPEQIVTQLHLGDVDDAPRRAQQVTFQAGVQFRDSRQAPHGCLDDTVCGGRRS